VKHRGLHAKPRESAEDDFQVRLTNLSGLIFFSAVVCVLPANGISIRRCWLARRIGANQRRCFGLMPIASKIWTLIDLWLRD